MRRSTKASLRATRLPLATSAPASIAATSRGRSDGWFCRSPSIVTTIGPRARAMPACMAGCWPKFRLNDTTRTRWSRSCSRVSSSSVESVEPSSMKIISALMPAPSVAATMPSYSASTVRSSFSSGITMLTAGVDMLPSVRCGWDCVATS